MKFVLPAVIIFLLMLAGTSSNDERDKHEITKRSVAQQLPNGVDGKTVSSALDFFSKALVWLYSKIFAKLTNYTKWPLSSAEYKVCLGDTSDVPSLVLSGDAEAWAGDQVLFGAGTEGVGAWSTTPGRFCAVYWKVETGYPWRASNKLGIGCTANTGNNSLGVKSSDKCDSLDYMTFQEYGSYQPTIQVCDEDILCVQAIMDSNYESKATIHIIPKNVANLAPNMRGKISQADLDQILNPDNTCKLGCSNGSVTGYMWQLFVVCLTTTIML